MEWWNGGIVEWWGGASLLNELEAKRVLLGGLSVDFRRIFNLLEDHPLHN